MLGSVPDPRDPRGVRYPLAAVLALAVGAVACGARSFVAIGEWAEDADRQALARLGIAGRGGPQESTFRRICQDVDADELDRAWVPSPGPAATRWTDAG